MKAYLLGVATVFLTAAASVIVRAYADAVFLDVYGASSLPQLFMTQALAFAVATAAYDALLRRARGVLLDGVVIALLGAGALVAPSLSRSGGRGLGTFAMAVGLVAISSVAALAANHVVGHTVSGRDARRLMPRAGAALTAGGVLAGFGASAFIARFGLARLPLVAAGLASLILVFAAWSRAAAPPQPPAGARPEGREPRALLGWIAAAAFVEAVLNVVLEFHFKSELRAQMGGDRLGMILAAFMGATNTLLLFLQIVLVPRLVVSQRLPINAALHPLVVMGALGAGAALPALAAAALARGVDSVLRAATGRACQDVAMSPLAAGTRERWKVLIRGVLIPLGSAVAGAGLLLVTPPRWASAALALLLLVLWRAAAGAFRDLLAAPLGVRTAERRADGLDLDALVRLIDRSGSADADEARLARAALARAGHGADELAPYLDNPDARVRAALFAMAARHPSPAAADELRAAVAVEDDDQALIAGLRALAAHDDDGAVDRARALRGLGGEVGRAAAAYLAQLGRVPAAECLVAARAVDGAWAAAIARGAGLDAAPAAGIEAHRYALASGDLEPWLAALAAGDPEAARAMAGMPLPDLRGRDLGPLTVRVLQAARLALPSSERTALFEAHLADPDPQARDEAARGAARAPVDADAVHRGLAVELDLLEALLAAREPADTLLRGELAVETRRSLARALAIAALAGNAAAVRAAGRHLEAPRVEDRLRALDLLQEIARTEPRLTKDIERWLAPAFGSAALEPALEADAWLARVASGELAPLAACFARLRAHPALADASGETLAALAARLGDDATVDDAVVTHLIAGAPDLSLGLARILAQRSRA